MRPAQQEVGRSEGQWSVAGGRRAARGVAGLRREVPSVPTANNFNLLINQLN
jgi:hypothetical protein